MKIEDVFYKLRPICGKQLDLLWQEYLVADPPLRKTIEKILRVQLARKLGETFESEQVLLKLPPRELVRGEYPLGTIHYGRKSYYEFGLKEDEFIQHIGIFGRSGSGKTNLAYLILQGLVKADKPFLVFDWKRNYRDLLNRPEFSDMYIFTVGRKICPFRFNPLVPPPGTPGKVWLKKLIEIMCHAYFLGEGVSILLLRAIDALYRDCGLYTGKPKGYPTIANVRSWLNNYGAKGREGGWMESAVRAVETLCFGEAGNVLNSGPFFDITKLLDKQVVLELDALTNADKTFLIEALLLWIHHYRMAQVQREKFKHAIIIEEAHHILLRKKQEATGEETVTDVILREIRELGESIICLDQHPSLISKPALGNTYTTFAMNLKHRGDISMIQDSLLLNSEQAGYLGRLEVGWSIVRLQGRWFWPFLVKFPLVMFEKGSVTDNRLRKLTKQKDFSCLLSKYGSYSPVILAREEISSPKKTQDKGILPFLSEAKRGGLKDKNEMCAIRLTTQEEDFLKDVWQHKTSSITERYSRLSFSCCFGNKLQNSLFNSDFISSSLVILPRGRIKILKLTEKGKKVLGINTGESDRHGGPEHRYWVKRIADHLQANGYEVAEEVPVGGGKTIDIVAAHDDKRIAFEIETGKSDAAANVRKCLDAGLNKVVVVATSALVRDKLSTTLPRDKRVKLLTAAEVLQRN
ncbi:MAG: ATP-binding protein [Planctomycetes bacterium]|nr:ATP-binding protein [Planctomycetota bacterium]